MEKEKNAEAINFVFIRSDWISFLHSPLRPPHVYVKQIFFPSSSNSTCAWITTDCNYQRMKMKRKKKVPSIIRRSTSINCYWLYRLQYVKMDENCVISIGLLFVVILRYTFVGCRVKLTVPNISSSVMHIIKCFSFIPFQLLYIHILTFNNTFRIWMDNLQMPE